MMKKILVLGANGATGRLVVAQLLAKGVEVKALVRSKASLPGDIADVQEVELVEASINDLSVSEIRTLLIGCDAVISCLGHNLTFSGMFGEPRRLVSDTVKKLHDAVSLSQQKVRFVLMNTAGNSNRDISEIAPLSQRLVVGILRKVLPPHTDNEAATDYLFQQVGHENPVFEWVVVRPDGLFDEATTSTYELHVSPTRNAIFNAGRTSRINVANFMASLLTEETLWTEWKSKMPVIYNGENNTDIKG